jgi:hypothetical protein
MNKSKYGKYIVFNPKPNRESPNAGRTDAPGPDIGKFVFYVDHEYPPGANYMEGGWLVKAYPDKVWARAHTHEFDELIGFYGSDMNDVNNLGGEIEIWLEDEKFILTKSCTIFVPKGMKHCPLIIKRIDRPIFHFTASPSGKYVRELVNKPG